MADTAATAPTGFGRNVALLGGSAIAAQVVQAAAAPALTRLYGPSAFGTLALVTAMAGIVASVGGLRYELAIVLCDDDAEAANALSLYMLLSLASAAVGLALILALRPQLGHWFGAPALVRESLLVPVIVVLVCAGLAAGAWLLRQQEYGRLAGYRAGSAVVLSGAQLGLVEPTAHGPAGLVLGHVAGLATVLLLLVGRLRRSLRFLREHVSIEAMRAVATRWRKFPRFMMPYSVVSELRDRGVNLVLGIYATTTIVGFFALAVRLLYTTVGSLSHSSVGQVVYRRAVAEDDVADAAPLVRQVLVASALLAPGFVAVAWASTGHNLALLLGKRWHDAGVYVALFALPSFAYLLSGVLDRMLDIVGHQRTAFRIELGYSLATFPALAVGLWGFDSPKVAVGLFAVVTTVYHLVFMVAVFERCRFPLADLRAVVLTSILGAATAALALGGVSALWTGSARLAIGLGLAGVYGLALLATGRLTGFE